MAYKPSQSATKVLQIIPMLSGKEFDGVRQSEIARALGVTDASVGNYMLTLSEQGFAERVPGREEAWRLGPKLIQISTNFQLALARYDQRGEEVKNRFTREI